MKVDVTHPEKNVAVLDVGVEPERIEQARQQVYRRLVGRHTVPGFRRGKAPLLMLERFLGQQVFDQEVLDQLLDESYREAAKQAGIEPVTTPDIELEQWQRGQALVFRAKVTTKPEVTLGQYTGIEVPREQPVITDEVVTAEMEALRRRLSTVADAPPEATLGVGGMATLDFAGAVDGRPFDGGTAEGYVLELGSGFLLPGFEEQLLGAKLGEEREVVVTFPVDARSDLAGKEARFKVTVKGYRVRQLPEPNDEFARQAATALGVTVGESGFGLDALRAELRRRLEASAEARARAVFEGQVIERVVRNAQLDVPAVMVRARAEALAQDFDRALARQGMTRQAYLAAATETEEHLEQSFGSRAAAQLKRELVLEAIARKESIQASDQEVDERVTTLARLGGEEPARLRQTLADNQGLDGVRDEIVERKTIDYLMGAQVVVPAAAAAPETAAPETAALATAEAAAPATEAATPAAPAKKARRAPSKKTTGGKKAEEDVEVSVEPEADQAGKPGPQPKRPRTKGRATKEDQA